MFQSTQRTYSSSKKKDDPGNKKPVIDYAEMMQICTKNSRIAPPVQIQKEHSFAKASEDRGDVQGKFTDDGPVQMAEVVGIDKKAAEGNNPPAKSSYAHAQGTTLIQDGKTVYTTPVYTKAGEPYSSEAFETLYSISKKYEIKLEQILNLNPNIDPEKLLQGQRIVLSVDKVIYSKDEGKKQKELVITQADVNIVTDQIKNLSEGEEARKIDMMVRFLKQLDESIKGNATQKYGFEMYGKGKSSEGSPATKLEEGYHSWGTIDLSEFLDLISVIIPQFSNKTGKGVVAGKTERLAEYKSRFVEIKIGMAKKDPEKVAKNVSAIIKDLQKIKKEIEKEATKEKIRSEVESREQSAEYTSEREKALSIAGLREIYRLEQEGWFSIHPLKGSIRPIHINDNETKERYKDVLKYAVPINQNEF